MLARLQFLSLAAWFCVGAYGDVNPTLNSTVLDVNSSDSIKTIARTLASAIMNDYNDVTNIPGGVPGLFDSEKVVYSFWETGTVWNSLVEYSNLTGDTQFNQAIASGVLFQISGTNDFMPPNQTMNLTSAGQSSWALTAMAAAEAGLAMPKDQSGKWVDLAINVFNDQVAQWDIKTCGGGIRSQVFPYLNGYLYKDSWTASSFFLLSARLAQFTGNKTYSDWAEKAFQWSQDLGLVKDFHVYGSGNTDHNCSSISKSQYTNDHATFTEASAIMYNITKGSDKWKSIVTGFLNTTSVFQNGSPVLEEQSCERTNTCDRKTRAFKGAAVRYYARTIKAAPFAAEKLQKILDASATAALGNCNSVGEKVYCGFRWWSATPDDTAKDQLGELHNALSVVHSLLRARVWNSSSGSSGSGNAVTPTTSSGAAKPSESGTKSGAGRLEGSWGYVVVVLGFAIALI